jgi:hypothetical protein
MISKLTCKFCHCTDARPCLIPMSFGTHPLSYGRDPLDYEQLPIVVGPRQVAEFTTPCHWSAPDICSGPACIEKAYVETCEALDQLIIDELMMAGELVA